MTWCGSGKKKESELLKIICLHIVVENRDPCFKTKIKI